MATSRRLSDTFAQAWTAVTQSGNRGAQAQLTELEEQSQGLSADHPRQDDLLSQVVALLEDLRPPPDWPTVSAADQGAGRGGGRA